MKDWNIKEDKAQNAIYLKEDNGGKGRFFRARFLQPGLVKYSFGVCLLKKEVIDKFVYKFVGCPVVIDHKDVSDKNAKDLRVGVISKVEFEQFDGWYWCEGVIFDQEAIDLVNNGYNVSCQYEITQYATNDRKELHNGNEYDKEILDGAPEHLAIVKNPRYESAMIAVNAIDLTASNEEKWITIKPHGEESDDYRRLKLEDGESPKEAIKRVYKDGKKEEKTKDENDDNLEKYIYKERSEKDKKNDGNKHQKVLDLEDKAYKEFKIMYDNYINGDVKISDFGKAKEQFNKKYKDAFENLESDRFVSFEDFAKRENREADDAKKKEQTYYEPDMEETYTKAYEDAIKKDFDDFMKAQKEKKESNKANDIETKKAHYQDTLKKIKEANKRGNAAPYMSKEMLDAFKEERELKTELTKARREYAESIMDNFEESDNNAYEEKQAARRERYAELSDRASKESSSKHQQFRDKMSVIPGGQPIHGAKDARYREKAWETLGRAVRLGEKADYYADKANSVGKAGISSDDANAIAKLAKKYKSGVDSAEKRRIIDRVIDLHQRKDIAAKGNEDFSDLGFKVERNSDINRLQLKFDGKPDESTRNILKSYGFRWSPREGAWQRQLTGNAEYSLKQVAEKLKANNSFVEEFKNTLYDVIAGGIANRLGELIAQNKNSTEKWITIKGNHILLKDGESIADAFKRTTGASLSKGNKYEQKDTHTANEAYKKILDNVKKSNEAELTPDEVIINALNKLGIDKQKLLNKINEADMYNAGVYETNKRYSDGNGVYKRDRAEYHKEIIKELFKNAKNARPKNGEKPTFMFLGGRGGSGKSKFDGLVYDKNNYIVLDADAIKELLPEYKGYNAFEVHEESSDILKQALRKAQKEGLNVVLDATMKSLGSSEKHLKSFEDAGYNIEMYYMHLPREKAAERAIGRFMGKNGRYVPLEVLLSMKDNEANFDKLKKYASKWAFYNNDVASKEDEPILVDKNY